MAAKTEKTAQSSEKTAKPRGKPFPKGQSGNPGGRPKTDPEVKALLKGATPAAAQLLIQLMEDPDNRPELRKACAESILDRVYGKATQPIDGALDATVQLLLSGELKEYAN